MEHVSKIITEHWIFLLVIAYMLCCCVEASCKHVFGGKCGRCKNYEGKEKSQ